MTYTRRSFLQTAGVAAAAVAGWPSVSRAAEGDGLWLAGTPPLVPAQGRWTDPDLMALAERAVDAAKAAGAAYADVRLTLTREQGITEALQPGPDKEWHGAGVRVLVNGFWGFMGSAVWTPDEMIRLARGAVRQAKANGLGGHRDLDLGTVPPVADGAWHMPVKYDPFDVPQGEKIDCLRDIMESFRQYDRRNFVSGTMMFNRQRKVFASSDGSRWTQTHYVSGGSLSISYQGQYSLGVNSGVLNPPIFTPAGKGWEYIIESDLMDRIPELTEEANQMRFVKPVEINRYDVVFSAHAIATLADSTIGAATELDRAMGYEANAGGTSYLNDPLEMLGTYQVGSSHLNFSADRSTPGALATARWDDEAVVPDTFPIVKDGILVDFQTTREQAEWLAPYYKKVGKPVRSHGCAGAQSALSITLQQPPNFRVNPGADDIGFDDLVRDTKKGLAVIALRTSLDQQQLNGTAYPIMREIRNGKFGKYIYGGGFMFRGPEFWRNLVAVGGQSSEAWFGFSRVKGQPIQQTMHSVGAVPAKITNVGIIDAYRKA